MQQVREKTKYVVKPWYSDRQVRNSSELMSKWSNLADKIGAAWRGSSAVEEIRDQRTKNYDSNHR